MANKLPTVAIVGIPNVGKSSLFNRLVRERIAITNDQPGVTRDRIYGICEWLDRRFYVIDTGGITLLDQPLQQQIKMQAEIAIDQADVIIFVCDGRVAPNEDDHYVSKLLKKSGKPIILAINKIDDISIVSNTQDFFRLGIGVPYPVSSIHGIGVGDVLDQIAKKLPPVTDTDDIEEISFCVIGRPNVGKSSLVNAILHDERVIVSDISGTTRDAIDTPFTYNDKQYKIIDTAGLNKRGKIYEAVDKYSAIRALRAIDRSDICLLVCDLGTGIQEQDKHVISYALEANKAIILVMNKYDLIENKETNTISNLEKIMRIHFQFLSYAPIVFLSALKGKRTEKLFPVIERVYTNYHRRVSTSTLNEVVQDLQLMNPPPDFNGGRIKLLYANQTGEAPPNFVIFTNNPAFMHFSYQRYIENRIRATFDFEGAPLRIVLRGKNK